LRPERRQWMTHRPRDPQVSGDARWGQRGERVPSLQSARETSLGEVGPATAAETDPTPLASCWASGLRLAP
jgi:hypothetical protein